MEVLSDVGLKVDYRRTQDLFHTAGARVNEEQQNVRIPEELVNWAIDQAPEKFNL